MSEHPVSGDPSAKLNFPSIEEWKKAEFVVRLEKEKNDDVSVRHASSTDEAFAFMAIVEAFRNGCLLWTDANIANAREFAHLLVDGLFTMKEAAGNE